MESEPRETPATDPDDDPGYRISTTGRRYRRWVPQPAREVLGIESDEIIASGAQWEQPRSKSDLNVLMRARNIAPFATLLKPNTHEPAVNLWAARDVQALHEELRTMYKGGWWPDPELDIPLASKSTVAGLLGVHPELFVQRALTGIAATPRRRPFYRGSPERPTDVYSTHAYLAAFTHERQRLLGARELVPDWQSGKVLASITIWARELGYAKAESVERALRGTHERTEPGYVRGPLPLFADDVVAGRFSERFNAHHAFRAQVEGYLILPGTTDRYTILGATDTMRYGQRVKAKIEAMSVENRPATYYREHEVFELKRRWNPDLEKPTIPDDDELAAAVALPNRSAGLAARVAVLRRESLRLARLPSIALGPDSVGELNGVRVALASYFLAHPSQVVDEAALAEVRATLGEAVWQAKVTKPDEWTKPVLMEVFPLEASLLLPIGAEHSLVGNESPPLPELTEPVTWLDEEDFYPPAPFRIDHPPESLSSPAPQPAGELAEGRMVSLSREVRSEWPAISAMVMSDGSAEHDGRRLWTFGKLIERYGRRYPNLTFDRLAAIARRGHLNIYQHGTLGTYLIDRDEFEALM